MSVKLETISELARRIGKSERQIRGWIDNSLLRHNRIGGRIEIPEGAYEEMLQATEVPPKPTKSSRRNNKLSLSEMNINRDELDADILDQLAADF